MIERDVAELAAFRKAIKENPYDDAARRIFADWLDDHDLPEEAQIQRDWTAQKQCEAEEFFDKCARDVTLGGADGYGDPLPDGEVMTSQMLLEAGRSYLEKGEPLWLPMNNAGLDYDVKSFWKHFGVLTDQTVRPDDVGITECEGDQSWEDGGDFIRCAC